MIVKGAKINDRYQIIKTLGEGGMANVYLAYDTILNRNVAVKILRGDLASDDKFVRRFQREALSASSLSHPNIVEMYDVGVDDGQYYIVMEYVDGKTLKQLLKKRGSLTVTEVIDIMLQLTDGMAHAHDSYIIHRDIKPQNIMILENGLIKITDFGIAMALNSTQLTQTNSVMGSVHYLPPEQANGKGSTTKSDIYSMGILMYELLTGAIPYKGDNAVEIALKHLKEPLPSIRKTLPELPQSMENVIIKATAKNPKNRYASAREMHEDIKTALDESRVNEPRCVYKYSENDLDETKVLTDEVKEVKEKIEKEKKEQDSKKDKSKKETKSESKSQNKLLITLGSIFVGLILIVTCLVVLLPKFMTAKSLVIPDVATMNEVDAYNTLVEAGFNVLEEVSYIGSDTIAEGLVVKTSPAIGKKVKEKTTITLFISSGKETFTMPEYAGKNKIEVETILRNMYECTIQYDFETVKKDDKYIEDSVLSTVPAAGEEVSKGSVITIILGEVEVVYPDFTDGKWDTEKIQKFCEENELTLKLVYQDGTEEGKIVKQSRAADSVVAPGSTITITVSKVPEHVDEVPIDEEDIETEE